jgi:hypothetical protein
MTHMRSARRFAIGFFVVYVAAVIYPVVAPLRGPRPFVFGMPFALVWAAAWIVAAFFVLLVLDRAYSAAERAHDAGLRGYDTDHPDTGWSGYDNARSDAGGDDGSPGAPPPAPER